MNIEYKYELNEKVKILPFEGKEGRIIGIYYSHYGLKYYTSYYADCEDKYAYFYEEELEAIS